MGAKSILQGAHYAEDLANRSPATGIARLNLKTGGSTNILTVDPLEQDTPCPEDHFQCPSGHCIPLLLRCNAVSDCPGHEDELGCGRYTCPGFYRCRGFHVCVHPSWLCDGVPHCPQGDDEWLCDRPSTCPPGCRCQGLAFVCPRPFPVHGFPDLRYLDASGSGLAPGDFTTCWYLVNLVLADCRLDHITPVSFPNLRFLDLSRNQFVSLDMSVFAGLENMRALRLAVNPLVTILLGAQIEQSLKNLLEMDISGSQLKELNMHVFSLFPALKVLNVSRSELHTISDDGFKSTPALEKIDLSSTPLLRYPPDLFRNLSRLQSVRADDYRLCCQDILPEHFPRGLCSAPPHPVSSCKYLLSSGSHRAWLWSVCLLSIVGNSGCLLYRS